MLLSLTTTYEPASDLGYLLGKHPDRIQSFPLAFGRALVFFPEAAPERCTVCLMLELDPIGLVRGRPGARGDTAVVAQYVNDRPYVASSFLSVAIADVFSSALAGKSRDRPELARTPIPLAAELSACRGAPALVERLFKPLGYAVECGKEVIDPVFPAWGRSPAQRLTLTSTTTLSRLLSHLYVLIPVLDRYKHYFIAEDEVDKLLRHGEGWLNEHPERDLITRSYLKRRSGLIRRALDRLREDAPEPPDPDPAPDAPVDVEPATSTGSLAEQRRAAILAALRDSGAERVLDLGCGEGRLLQALLGERWLRHVTGVDASHRALEIAADRLKLDRIPAPQRARIDLLHGALTYRDDRLRGFDAAVLSEVVEHLDPPRLAALERAVFESARPRRVVVTTPNREYNPVWESLPEGRLRHPDHRFEWSREEFCRWCADVGARQGYAVTVSGIGDADPERGSPTQLAVFTLHEPCAGGDS